MKGVYIVGTQSQYILAWASGTHQDHDLQFLNQLKRDVAHYGQRKNGKRCWILLADAGFDAAQLSALDFVPTIRRGGKLVDVTRKGRADQVAQARSVIKRLFGDTIRSRSHQLQLREPIIFALLYNLHR